MQQSKKKVLLAEHIKETRDILLYLFKAWDYDIATVEDGAMVQETVRKEQPDIIIIDSNLSNIDGLKVSRILKEDFLTAHIPVIILIDKRQIRKKMLDIEQGVDDYITSPPDPIDLEVRMEMALRRTTHQLYANGLTRLPGNRQIEKIINARIHEGTLFSVAYYDIDNFKSYNDKYGYMKGDNVIRHTAFIISQTVKKFGNKDDFVGHIGGDDFVAVTTPKCDRIIASESILNFNKVISFHYNREDRHRAYIVAKDRKGNVSNIPLMTITIAIANNSNRPIKSIVELMEIITGIKRYLKTLPGSNFLVNRRQAEEKLFSEDKMLEGLEDLKHIDKKSYRPLGQILLDSKIITLEQLEAGLNKHWSTGRRIGQSLIDLGMVSPGDISRSLEIQLDIKHFDLHNLNENGELEEIISKIPSDLIKDYGVIPVKKEKNMIFLAMIDPRNIDAINKIKSFTGCGVLPFVVLESEFSKILDRVIKKADKGV